jgi:hypothetical protein
MRYGLVHVLRHIAVLSDLLLEASLSHDCDTPVRYTMQHKAAIAQVYYLKVEYATLTWRQNLSAAIKASLESHPARVHCDAPRHVPMHCEARDHRDGRPPVHRLQ